MLIKYVLDTENENDEYLIEYLHHVNNLVNALEEINSHLRDLYKYGEQPKFKETEVEKLKEEFYEYLATYIEEIRDKFFEIISENGIRELI